ncbi:hypothetical protein BT96DRAFT_947496 [Gymnopus androsaceus JB14]|uniref:MIT domain-containing protein n=1 Tax=Gymnopus androsaceus JB14 TaxID=1447944 RepID=A0A6A4GTE8_9AGAR|nr:hypothetical protein BT96DRAFT_947496 [Gymnopus androsaceus JB14]
MSRAARPHTSPSKRTRARRASLIPVPAPAVNRTGRMSMSMAPEQQQVSLGGAGLGLGVGAGFVTTEEQMQERISKMVQDDVERRLVEIREEERGRGLGLVKEEEQQEQQDKRKAKQEALVPDLDVESDSLPRRRNSSPSSPSEAVESLAQNSNQIQHYRPPKHARLLTFKKVMKEKVAEVKEEEEDESDLSRANTRVDTFVGGDEQVRDARRDSHDQQEYKKVRADADDEEIDFLTDPEWEDGNNGEDVVRVSGTHQESDRVKTEVEAPREVEEEEILSKPKQVIDGMDLDVVPEGPPGGWQVLEQEEVDQLIDDGDMDGDMGMVAGIETTTLISASSSASTSPSRISRAASASTSAPPANSQSPVPAPIAMRSSTSTADGRPAARRSSTSGSTSAAKSTSSDAPATTSTPKRARNVNAKSQEPATKWQLISSETASTPTRNSSPASAASSSSASADDKQTARAWLLQAKRAQDRNELPQALAFYQRAVSFVTALNGQLKHSHSPIPYGYRHRPKPESRHASSVSVPSPLSLSLSVSLSSSLPTPSSPSSASLSTGPSSSGTGSRTQVVDNLICLRPTSRLNSISLSRPDSRSRAAVSAQAVLEPSTPSKATPTARAGRARKKTGMEEEVHFPLQSQSLIPPVCVRLRTISNAKTATPYTPPASASPTKKSFSSSLRSTAHALDSESSPLGTQRPVISSRSSYSSIHSRTTPVLKPAQLNVKTESLPPPLGLPPTPVSPLSFPVTRPIWSQSSSIARSSVRTKTVIPNTGTEDGSGSPRVEQEFRTPPSKSLVGKFSPAKLLPLNTLLPQILLFLLRQNALLKLLPDSRSSSAGSASTGSASGVGTASLTSQDPDKSSKKSWNKRKLTLDDDEVAEEGHSSQELELQEIITKKRKDDKGKGKAPAIVSHSVSDASQDQLDQLEPEDEGQWEVPASVCAKLDRMESNEASGSGSSSLSSSGVPRLEPLSPLVPAIASPQAIALSAIQTPPSPPSITTVSAPAPPVFVEHDTDLDDQMEVDEVAGALGEVDRASSVEPSSHKEINTKRATHSHTRFQSSQSIRKHDAGSGLTNIKEEEEAEPDLSAVVEVDSDDGSEWEESSKKKKSQTRSKKASTRKTTVKSKSKATKSGKSKSTRKLRESAASALDPNAIPSGPSEQEEPDAGESQLNVCATYMVALMRRRSLFEMQCL